jgi:SAM-dependent MidA family methyltransferase
MAQPVSSASDSEMTRSVSLDDRLRERIRREGPITFRDWMDAALYDESEGYYCRQDRTRWGRKGDYRTSPERSQLFAATFARYFAKLYHELGEPSDWTIIEAGSGAGHFARGVLRTLSEQYPQVFTATHYLIDEKNASLQVRLHESINAFSDRVEFLSIDKIQTPINVGIVFSNELLDALPVHRVVMRETELLELCVGLNQRDEFVWIETTPTTIRLNAYISELGATLKDGQIAEVNLAAGDWLCRAASILERGYIVTVDYGAEAGELFNDPDRHEGTLRAFEGHRIVNDVFSNPGAQDITSTINWTHLKQVAASCGLETVRLERQDRFLVEEGLLDQLTKMTDGARGQADSFALRTEARDMVLPNGMSASFQVLVQRRPETRLDKRQ